MHGASGAMTIAHATTGPARGPRPTSSMPAINERPEDRSSRSRRLQRSAPATCSAPPGSLALRAHLALANAGGLSGEIAQVEQLRTPHATTPNDLDVGEHGAVHREDALDANTVGNLAYGERLAHTTAAARDADALEGLQTLLLTLTHTHIHPKGVSRAERRNVGAEELLLGFYERMHGERPLKVWLLQNGKRNH